MTALDEQQAALDSRYARFCLRPLSDADVWALSMATMVMPDGNPGAEAYLSQVSGTDLFAGRLTMWGRVVALGIAGAQYMAAGGSRRRTYVESYDGSWGRYAVADGLTITLYGYSEASATDRAAKLKCGRQGFKRVRDFVGGALGDAITEFRVALEWAHGMRRDRVLSGRWECMTGLNWSDAQADAKLGGQEVTGLMFAPGCKKTPPARTDLDTQDRQDPETLYHGLRPANGWSETQARWTRINCPARTIYPATDK